MACESLLDVNPTDRYSIETFWADEEQYNAALTGCYNTLYNSQIIFRGETDLLTPNALAYNEASGTKDIGRGAGTATHALFNQFWGNAYRGIGRANTFLDNIKDAPFDESKKNQMKGEALFLRALYYSVLSDHFGGVPLITETPDNDKHGALPRNSLNEVIDQIISDLSEAATLLPLSYPSSGIGRATKGAALALKSRVLLYNKRWAEAAQAAKEVIESDVYELFPDYRGMSLIENENNKEIIFDIQYQAPYFTHGLDNAIERLNRPAPTKDLVDAYLMSDGNPISESPLYDPDNPYDNKDPRLYQTVRVIGYPYNGKITTAGDVVTTGFGQKKLTTYSDDQANQITAGNSEVNINILRYGEVLLNYAEALNEANSIPDAQVYWALNQLRTRPTVNMPEVEQGLNKEDMREIIRLERRIELALEGLYYSDIRRWSTAEIVNNQPVYNHEGQIVEERVFNPNRDYLWPIPADEILENEHLVQNPGW